MQRPSLPRILLGLLWLLADPTARAAAPTVPPDMVLVPAGPAIIGSDATDVRNEGRDYGLSKPLYLDEHPRHQVFVEAFAIDRHEVTNAQYRQFVIANNYWVPPTWKANGYLLERRILAQADLPTLRRLATDTFELDIDTRDLSKDALLDAMGAKRAELDDLPVTGVSWQDADAYCRAVGRRLPSEVEWEKAARGPKGLEFPWGNEWSERKANVGADQSREPGPMPVGSFPAGRSPYGIDDMAGNVMEWVADWYEAYPGSDYQSKAFGRRYKVARGGGWGGIGHYVLSHFYRAAYRFNLRPGSRYNDLGFRCALSLPQASSGD